jgi:NADH:ubiquinone oxidoreductase subunit E
LARSGAAERGTQAAQGEDTEQTEEEMLEQLDPGSADFRQEQERERFMEELELVQRISRGLTTEDDAWYVARALGLTKEMH